MTQTQTQTQAKMMAMKEARRNRVAARRKIPPQTMTVAEAAARLGISEERAYRAVAANQIPTITLGDRKVVPIPAFERMLVDAVQPTSEDGAA